MSDTKNFINLLPFGPPGTGKSSAAEVVARELFGDVWEGNFTEINASDILNKGGNLFEASRSLARFYDERKGVLNYTQSGIARPLLVEIASPRRDANCPCRSAILQDTGKHHAYPLIQRPAAGRAGAARIMSEIPAVPGYEFFAHYQPVYPVGGDYYDFVRLPDDRLAVVVGDVAGKGIPAALMMAQFASETRHRVRSAPVLEAAAALNAQLHEYALEDVFITLCLGLLELGPRRSPTARRDTRHP